MIDVWMAFHNTNIFKKYSNSFDLNRNQKKSFCSHSNTSIHFAFDFWILIRYTHKMIWIRFPLIDFTQYITSFGYRRLKKCLLHEIKCGWLSKHFVFQKNSRSPNGLKWKITHSKQNKRSKLIEKKIVQIIFQFWIRKKKTESLDWVEFDKYFVFWYPNWGYA